MKFSVKIQKEFIHSGERFYKDNKIQFCLCKNGKEYDCIGLIDDFTSDELIIKSVYIDNFYIFGCLYIKPKEIKDGSMKKLKNYDYY